MPPRDIPEGARAFDPDLVTRVRRVFMSPDGAPILEMLNDYAFKDEVSDDDNPWRVIGRQDIVKYLNALLEESENAT